MFHPDRHGAARVNNRPGVWGRDRLWRPSVRPGAGAAPPRPRHGGAAAPSGSTTPRRRSPAPTRDAPGRARSGGRGAFFSGISRIGAGDPVLGAFPADAEPQQGHADGFAGDQTRSEALGATDLGRQIQRPQTGRMAKVAWAAMQERAQLLGALAREGPRRRLVLA